MAGMANAELTTPLNWREERRRDRLAAAQIGTQARIAEAEASAAKPWIGVIFVIEKAMVLMILNPPEAVPRPMTMAQARMTHSGIFGVRRRPLAKSPSVMIPMLFWASLSP